MTSNWPAGVIARFLTVGGATVDVSENGLSCCTGCGHNNRARWFGAQGTTETLAREWAQAHAETCRAMPRP